MKKLILLLFIFYSFYANSQSTDAALVTQSNIIKNETTVAGNTKERIAAMYKAIIDSKINISQLSYVVASGTDSYTATISPIPPTLTALRAFVYFTNANTGAATINFNGLGVKAMVDESGGALTAGSIPAGSIKLVSYNGTSFQLVGGSGGGGGGAFWPLDGNGNLTGDVNIDGPHQILFGDNTGDLELFSVDVDQLILTGSTSTDLSKSGTGNFTIRNFGTGTFSIEDGRAGALAVGIEYASDYSANYTSRSLIDKGYATATFATISSLSGYQPLDADLTSWAGITRAAGIDTWVATPSWTNFNSAITGTAPYWSLASGGTLTGNNTITQAGFNTTFSGIGKVTFSPTSGLAGMNVGSFAGDPSVNTNGDIHYNSVTSSINAFIGTIMKLVHFNGNSTADRVAFYSNSAGRIGGSANLTFDGTGFSLGTLSPSASVRMQVTAIVGTFNPIVTLHNSGGTERFRFREDGFMSITSVNNNTFNVSTTYTNSSTSQYSEIFSGIVTFRAATSDQLYATRHTQNFVVGGTTVTPKITGLYYNYTYTLNNTGADLIGLHYSPTLAGSQQPSTHLAIRTDLGSVFIANASGDTPTASTKLDVRGVSGGTIFRLANHNNSTLYTTVTNDTGLLTHAASIAMTGSATNFTLGGGATASELRFLEPSGSGSNFTAFKAVAQGSNITYSLPPTVGGAGTVLTDAAGDGVLTWTSPAGSGDMVLASTQTNSGAKTFLDNTLLMRNVANTFSSRFTNTTTAARVYTLKDADGTVAFTSDIVNPTASNGLNYATDVKLGGALTQNTDITGSFDLGITANRVGIGVAVSSLTTNTTLDVNGFGGGGSIARFADATDAEKFDFLSDGSIELSNSAGTSGQVLTSQGAGAAVAWTTVSGSGLTYAQVKSVSSKIK